MTVGARVLAIAALAAWTLATPAAAGSAAAPETGTPRDGAPETAAPRIGTPETGAPAAGTASRAAAPGDAAPAPGVPPEVAALPEAAPLAFSARVEPAEVTLGQPFRLIVEVRHPEAERYRLAAPPDLGGVELRGEPAVERIAGEDAVVTRTTFELAILDALGERALPPLTLLAEGPAGAARLEIPGPPVQVKAVSEGTELAPPPAPGELRVIAWDRIAIAAGLLAALLLGVLAFAWWRRRQARGSAAPPAPPLPPDERALRDLAALAAEGLPEAGRIREHHFRLSGIVRAWLEEVGSFPASEQTAAEVIAALEARPLPALPRDAVAAWFARGDLVRFASHDPGPAAAAADRAEAEGWIRAVTAARREEAARAAAAAEAPKTAEGGR